MDEFALIARIRERLKTVDPRVRLGVGDDAAVIAAPRDDVVVSVDAVVEGAHFDRRWLSWRDVGWRGMVGALSDLAAMRARPVCALLSLVLPDDLGEEAALALVDGAAEAAHAHGASIVGGNLARGPVVSQHTTVMGEAAHPLTRSGARPGDAIYVTGTLGAAALGWRLLAAGAEDDGPSFVARWRRPRARFDALPWLAHASACVDVSDGLAQDLGHLCAASGVGAALELPRVPVEPDHHAVAAAHGLDGDVLAASGGEDYELVFTCPASLDGPFTRVGEILEGEGVELRDVDGRVRLLDASGHHHFG